MGRVERLAAGTTVTLLEGIIVMVAPGLTLLTELPPPLPTALLVVTRVGLWLVGTEGILKIIHNHLSLLLDLSSPPFSPDLTHRHGGSLGRQVHGGYLCGG